MVAAPEFQRVTNSLAIWQAYDPAVKAELFSTAIWLGDRLFLIDPIRLAPDAFSELTAQARITSVFLTNANHARAAAWYVEQTGSAVLASAGTAGALFDLEMIAMAPGDVVGDRIEVLEIAGAAEGEIALYLEDDGGAVILGDALINFGRDGFALLPTKYCADQAELRRSLRQLLDFSFERLLFAHGTPIVSLARNRLEMLLAD